MVGRNEKPRRLGRTGKAPCQVIQGEFDRLAHVPGGFGEIEAQGASALDERPQLGHLRRDDDHGPAPAASKFLDDAFDDGGITQRESELRLPHAPTQSCGGDDGEGCVIPRLRHWINSATMLIAISGTVCEPIGNPRGA